MQELHSKRKKKKYNMGDFKFTIASEYTFHYITNIPLSYKLLPLKGSTFE